MKNFTFYLLVIFYSILSFINAQTTQGVQAGVVERKVPYLDHFDEIAIKENLAGTYYSTECNLCLTIQRNVIGEDSYSYTYVYESPERVLQGKVGLTLDTVKKVNLYITLKDIEYAEDFLDFPAPNKERQKIYDQIKERRQGKKETGIYAQVESNEIIIQNKRDLDDSYEKFWKLSDCDKEYIFFRK